ncbi:MAG TPA: PPC domain-containing protein [Myxococcota bacterium]|jgi:hypothetical protein|nr:PPC domain-containing protein [Myxococcota bacterium]
MRSCHAPVGRAAAVAAAALFAAAGVSALAGCGRTAVDVGDALPGTDAGNLPPDSAARCTGDPECDDGLVCNGVERCGDDGLCRAGEPPACDDGVDCSDDSCVEPGGCQSIPNHDLCPPAQLCNPAAGGCVMQPCMTAAECQDGFFCNGAETCTAGGFCAGGALVICDDFVACTTDACNEATDSCANTPVNALCDDGAFCNGSETCVPPVGCAPGVTVACGDGNACTLDVCDEATNACMNVPRDQDMDGFGDAVCGGSDCADLDPTRHPGAAENCANGVDEDCNALVDCADTACTTAPVCNMTCAAFEAACADGLDDDCDSDTDCADADCTGVPPCPAMCAATETSCTNMVDDDCDGAPDCLDTTCAAMPGCTGCMPFESCANGADDDCDTLVDCDDPACVTDPSCIICIGTEVCLNFNDDDCDGLTDCEDPDCTGTIFCAFCLPVEVCTGGADEDCNGLTDCDDMACAFDPSCLPGCQPESCVNLVDDDCDNLIDCADPDCAGNFFCQLCLGFELCFGLRDDDCDGLIDCGDPDCAGTTACSVCSAESCTNGNDDDCDSLIDCGDPDCAGSPFCGETCTPDGALACGDTAAGSNFGAGSTDTVTTYSCGATGQTAQEYVYTFAPATSGVANVTLTGLTGDLNLFVLTAGTGPLCDPELCAGQAVTAGPASETLSFAAAAGTTYFVVADGPGATTSNFDVTLACGTAGAEVCADDVDNDTDGFIDCADPDCAMDMACAGGACTPAETTTCSDTSTGNNGAAGSTDTTDFYGGSCDVGGDDGPEYVYTFTAASAGFVAATLGGLGADLDLFVLDAGPASAGGGAPCDADDCSAFSAAAGTGGESVIFPVVAGNVYHVVVDGFAAAVSDYTLTVFCTMM